MPGGPVAAGPSFGGLDERVDCLDTAVGEPGIERIEEACQCFLSALATALIGSGRQRRIQLYRLCNVSWNRKPRCVLRFRRLSSANRLSGGYFKRAGPLSQIP